MGFSGDVTSRDDRRVEKRRIDLVEDRVAVGAVDNRVIASRAAEREPGVDLELGGVGFAVDVDATRAGRRIVRGAASTPEIPWNTLRSARLRVNTPSSGVRPGSSLAHGPKVPRVAIAPGGTALSSVASNGIAVPVETLDIRRSWMSQTFGASPLPWE